MHLLNVKGVMQVNGLCRGKLQMILERFQKGELSKVQVLFGIWRALVQIKKGVITAREAMDEILGTCRRMG